MGQIKEVIWPDLHLIIEANMWRIEWNMPRLWIELVQKAFQALIFTHDEFEMSER